jgi:hypothetical protein
MALKETVSFALTHSMSEWGERLNDQSDSTNPSLEVEEGGLTEMRSRRSQKRTRVASSYLLAPSSLPNVHPAQQLGLVRSLGTGSQDGNSNKMRQELQRLQKQYHNWSQP